MKAPDKRAIKRALWASSPLVLLLLFILAIWNDFLPLAWATGIEGNAYAANFVLAFATVCGQAVIFINLCFYLVDIRPAGPASGGDRETRAEMDDVYWILLLCGVATFVYFVYAASALCGVRRPGWPIFRLDFFGVAARVMTVLMFAMFTFVDSKMARFWSRHLASMPTDGHDDDAKRATASRDFATMSVWLIDMPAIFVTLTSWSLLAIMSGAPFMSQQLDTRYESGLIWVTMQRRDVELFLHGVDSGVVIAAMLLSQFVFMWLMWRYRDGEV